jgi:MoaA/NifB/PqqE/SkfB family radical SAM enzyme
MYYQMSEQVYFVEGHVNGCLYDLKHSRLYLLNEALTQKFKLLHEGKLGQNLDDAELKKCLDYFVEQELVELTLNFRSNNIFDISEGDKKIKFAWIEVTNQCNLRCKHCYNESNSQCNSSMSLEQFRLVVDVLVENGIKSIQIIGGEPFWDKALLKEELDYALGKFKRIEIFTNGTLISEEWFSFLKENDISVALSVYSYDKDEHDKVTGVIGAWEKTNETIRRLKNYNIKYRVCNVLMKDLCLGEKNTDLYKLSEEKDVVRMSGRGNFALLSDDLIRKRLITKETFEESFSKAFCRRLVSGHNCFNSRIYISSVLDVYPCVMERRVTHCNLEKTKALLLNEEIRNIGKKDIDECKECEFRYACFDCRPNALSNNFYEKPWYCTYKPLDGVWEDKDLFIEKLKVTYF